MGHMKELLTTIYGGGDEAVAAVERIGKDWREQLEQAASEIERRWIPVSERLPDNDQPVLVWNSGGYCQKPWAWWQICDYEDGKWREQDERDEYPGVTHWMPLPPEPPNWVPLPKPPEVK